MSEEHLASFNYPPPSIPISPVLSWKSIGFRRSTTPSVIDATYKLYTTSGRSAISLALEMIGIKANDEVLIPSFHCTSMIDPVIWGNAIPVFFKIKNDLKCDLSHIERLITPKTRAIIVVHYFGFQQDTFPIRKLCDKYSISLIEDCAHSFFGGTNTKPIGKLSDYMIASTLKFFPIYDGGCLCSYSHKLPKSKTTRSSVRFELKSMFNCLERAFQYGRFKQLYKVLKPTLHLKDIIWDIVKRRQSSKNTNNLENLNPLASEGSFGFDPYWIDKKMTLASRIILIISDKKQIESNRRQNYNKWHRELSSISGGKPLFPELPDNVVPHVFPFIVFTPELAFPELKKMGMPILRFGEFLWDGIDENTCPTSIYLSKHLFQFPCHQELTETEIDWAITHVKNVINKHKLHTQPDGS